jgi:hypothetical protein
MTPAAAGGPVLRRAKVSHAEHESDEQRSGQKADEDESALHDGLPATSRPIAPASERTAKRAETPAK